MTVKGFIKELSGTIDISRQELLHELFKYNPSSEALVTAIYLSIELGDARSGEERFPTYTLDTIKAVRELLRLHSKECEYGSNRYSLELYEIVDRLLQVSIEQQVLNEIWNLLSLPGFSFRKSPDHPGFLFELDHAEKINHSYILEQLKEWVARNYHIQRVQKIISDEEHFRAIDGKLKTDVGRAFIIHDSNCVVEDLTPGFTSLQDTEGFLDGLQSEDMNERATASAKLFTMIFEQHFHVSYREALSVVYHPKDSIDIKSIKIQLENGEDVPLIDLLRVSSALIAYSNAILEAKQLAQVIDIPTIRRNLIKKIKENEPFVSETNILAKAETYIAANLEDLQRHTEFLLPFIKSTALLARLRTIEELKNKSSETLIGMLDLLCALDMKNLYAPIHAVEGKYYLVHQLCDNNFNLNLYNYYLSNIMFDSSSNASQKIRIGTNHKNREADFLSALKNAFKQSKIDLASTKIELQFPEWHESPDSAIDFVAYSEKENALLLVEVKLSNTPKEKESAKRLWISNMLNKKAKAQLKKDIELVLTDKGLNHVGKQLELTKDIMREGLSIYSLIVTDNFYADHGVIKVDNNLSAIVVSYFELSCLLLGIQAHPNQTKIAEPSTIAQLIKLVAENKFWSFLKDVSSHYKEHKMLRVVHPKYRIELRI